MFDCSMVFQEVPFVCRAGDVKIGRDVVVNEAELSDDSVATGGCFWKDGFVLQ
jgi:hypothetical protein